MPGWVIRRAGALPGDDGQLLILAERDAYLADARANYDRHGDARRTLTLLEHARERQCKVMWARRVLGTAATAPTALPTRQRAQP